MRTRTHLYDGATFEHRGRTFQFKTERDDHMGEPWKEHDGHGEVSDWRRDLDSMPSKAPGERVLVRDRHSARYYDFAGAVALARKDGWGCKHSYTYNVGRHVFVSGHATAGELAACAAECDFERMRGWCTDQWYWCTVVITLLEENDDQEIETNEVQTLSGIESDAGDYFEQVAKELADEIMSRVEVDEPDVQVSEN